MDDVAARAAVSKQTVYKQFADKQRLFTEVITSDVGRWRTPCGMAGLR
jgi:TetR/AcrR family transcriptional regulator, mexJK operon transcriptional repressor